MRAWLLVLVTACGYPHLEHVGRLTGTVHGLWDGTSGVVLHLATNGVDRTITVQADGPFEFPDIISDEDLYALTVLSAPPEHTCMPSADEGKLASSPTIDIACTGPSVEVATSAPIPWTFDPTADEQTVEVSLLTQELGLIISSAGNAVASAQVDGKTVALGVKTLPTPLPLGVTTFSVTLLSNSGFTKTYALAVDRGTRLIEQAVYLKASNARAYSGFGTFFTTFDGDVLAIAAPGESSATAADPSDTSKPNSGAVYVFRRTGATWTQEAYLKASNPDADDNFGFVTAVEGDVIAVGAYGEASSAVGVNPTGAAQSLNDAAGAGAVYVFRRVDGTWTQEAYIKAPDAMTGASFGFALAMHGNYLSIGAPNAGGGGGGVYSCHYNGVWTCGPFQSPSGSMGFGYSVALGGDPNAPTLVAGAINEDNGAGGAYILKMGGGGYQRVAASDAPMGAIFGATVAISGGTVVIGAPKAYAHTSNLEGRAYVFEQVANRWTQTAELQASNVDYCYWFGLHVAVYGDLIAVGAVSEGSQATGINQPPEGGNDDLAPFSGAAYVYRKDASGWTQAAYIKASNARAYMSFGDDTALSGNTLIVGARNDSSAATGIDPPGGQADTSAPYAGALYIFR